MLIAEREVDEDGKAVDLRHYSAIKSLSRLLRSSNSKHKCKQHFCMNCLQGFPTKISRDKHFEYCKVNKTVRIEMSKEGSLIEFHDDHYQFKVPFIICTDFEAILEPIQATNSDPERPYTKEINKHIPSGFWVYIKFVYGKVKNSLKKTEDFIICFLKSQ